MISSTDLYLNRTPKPNGKSRQPELPKIRRLPFNLRGGSDIQARYDLAETTTDNAKHWARADAFDADSANSQWVRNKMVQRSRYETGNNGILDGLTKSDATFVIRTGPRLRLTGDTQHDLEETPLDHGKIKRDWHRWCRVVQLRRKLWAMAHAKVQDGEAFAVVRYNPSIRHEVQLDVVLFETEQCKTPMLPIGVAGYVDGIRFDPYGNPVYYDVLPQHPGSQGIHRGFEPDAIPARYVLHWYLMERPGQHRGVPSFKSTLELGAVHRRWRDAVVAGAESIADIALLIQTQNAPDEGPMEYAPFSTIPWQKRMNMLLPMGWNAFQPQGTQPPANYEMFMRSHIQELARPRSIPYNLAAADSSNSSFAGGKLDLFPYYMQVDDVDREDCNDLVLDKLFSLWWQEYVLANHAKQELWDADPDSPPDHVWDWPRNPIADEASEVRTNAEKLRTGQAAPEDIAHENGQSYNELIQRMADNYGKTVDEIKDAMFQVNIAPKSGGMLGQPEGGEQPEEEVTPLNRVMESLGLKSPTAKPAPVQKGQKAPVQNRVQPEQNGEDAMTIEQLSFLVGSMALKVNDLCAIVAEQKRADDGKFSGDGGTFRKPKEGEVERAENRLKKQLSEADEGTRRVLQRNFNQSELDLAKRGEQSGLDHLLRSFGDDSPSAASEPAVKPGDKVKLNLWKGASAFGTLQRNSDGTLSVSLEKAEGIDPATLKKKLPTTLEDLEKWLGSLAMGEGVIHGSECEA